MSFFVFPGPGAVDPTRRGAAKHGHYPLLLAVSLAALSAASLAQEPYRFYGGDVTGDGKTPEMEACEYEELVEKQRCNRSLNKSRCIDRVRQECRRTAATEEKPDDRKPQPR